MALLNIGHWLSGTLVNVDDDDDDDDGH